MFVQVENRARTGDGSCVNSLLSVSPASPDLSVQVVSFKLVVAEYAPL